VTAKGVTKELWFREAWEFESPIQESHLGADREVKSSNGATLGAAFFG
jgi:hypothetical protein